MSMVNAVKAIRRGLVVAGLGVVMAGCATSGGAPAGDGKAEVTAAAERLRLAMIDPNASTLDGLVAEQLSYGHSGGRVDTKQSFIGDLMNGKSDFVTLDLTEQTVALSGDVALIRHALSAQTNDSGKPGTVSLKVLQVWQRQGAQWKLVARQAVRTPT
jgi:hypothetical protein